MKQALPNLLWLRLGRAPLVVMGLACLVTAVWGGLLRLSVNLPPPGENANWITLHGPLMVCGFLGTVIGLERAVGLRSWWTYLPPLLTGIGSLAVVAGITQPHPLYLITAGSAAFVAVTIRVILLQRVLFTTVMSVGALAWVVGNILWIILTQTKTTEEEGAAGTTRNFSWIIPWWFAFLALTIVGERLDLNRFARPSRWSRPLLYGALGLFLGGVILSAFRQVPGEKITGLGLLALAAWLGWFDLARRTVKQTGLTRYMAVCLLIGYFWMAISGVLFLWHSPLQPGQFSYDAALHSFFLGFIFSMIFGHAPVIFPAVLNFAASFRPIFYVHLILLHLALALRVGGDITQVFWARQWGAILNGIAVALFLLNTVVSIAWPAKNKVPGR